MIYPRLSGSFLLIGSGREETLRGLLSGAEDLRIGEEVLPPGLVSQHRGQQRVTLLNHLPGGRTKLPAASLGSVRDRDAAGLGVKE